jgi:hypothetical protein
LQAPKSVPKTKQLQRQPQPLCTHTHTQKNRTHSREGGGKTREKKAEKGGLVGNKSKANNTTNNNQQKNQKNKSKSHCQSYLQKKKQKTCTQILQQLSFSSATQNTHKNKIKYNSLVTCELQRLLGKNFCGAPV